MPESSGNNHRDYSIFDSMSTEVLEDILRADSQLPDSEDSDIDAILYIMEVIVKREEEHPTGRFTDINTAWASFCENYLPYAEDSKSLYDFEEDEQSDIKQTPSAKTFPSRRKRRLMRVASIAAIVAALLLASTVTASALGFDLWGAVAKWTRDTFGFSSSTPQETISDVQGLSGKTEFDNLQSTLDQYGITAGLAPTWFPDGYSFESVNVTETPTRTTFHAIYKSEDNEILVTIALLSEPSTRTYEKDGYDVTVYLSNEIEHYIMTNLDRTNMVWKAENYECSVSGKLSLEDAKKMIDSIYERN